MRWKNTSGGEFGGIGANVKFESFKFILNEIRFRVLAYGERSTLESIKSRIIKICFEQNSVSRNLENLPT